MSHNEFVSCMISTLSEPMLAGLSGSHHPDDQETLQLDWLEAVQAPDVPVFRDWGEAWDWYVSRLEQQYPDQVRLGLVQPSKTCHSIPSSPMFAC